MTDITKLPSRKQRGETKLSNVMEKPKKRKKKVLTKKVDSEVNVWNSFKLFFVFI